MQSCNPTDPLPTARITSSSITSTGIPGLDKILRGGLPERNLYMLQGWPGSGKTTAALQFLLAGIAAGERCTYVSLSQSRTELELIAASHGWSLKGINVVELSSNSEELSPSDQSIFQTAELRLDKTRETIERAIDEHGSKRLVYDSLLEIKLLTGNIPRFRRELVGFKSFLAQRNIVALLLDTHFEDGLRSEEVEGIAHGVIRLHKSLEDYGGVRRRIEVGKMRGVPIADGYHDMTIREGEGVVVFPRLLPGEVEEAGQSELIKSGVAELDEMFGGGQEGGTTTLVMGQSGTGKSTMASLYATAALERGENVAIFLFEERLETFFRRSEGLGMDLRGFHDQGKLIIRDFNPNEISPGEFGQIVQKIVSEDHSRVVVIDSLTGYINSLPHRDKAVRDIQGLLKYLSRSGVLTMLIVAQHGLLGENVGTDVDVSFLGDTVLLLRIREDEGRLRRNITVAKKRHGPHELNIRELFIDPTGVRVVPYNPVPET